MKKIFTALLVSCFILTGCSFGERGEYVEPEITIGKEVNLGPTDLEQEEQREIEQAQAEKEAEALRKAEEERLAQEAEQKRIAELEAENQRKQKEAEEQAILEAQQEAARQQAERLKNTPRQQVAPPPAPGEVGPATSPTPAWITYLMDQYGTYAAPGTVFIMTNDLPCGPAAAGCTSMTRYSDGTYSNATVRIRPQYENEAFLLFHEIAHTHRIGLVNECDADMWAKDVLGMDPNMKGAYC